jgi:[ribosomal protein S5]-alanine N-acetyltransferase
MFSTTYNPTWPAGHFASGPAQRGMLPFPALATARLRLRPLVPRDTLEIAAIAAEPESVDGTLDAPSPAEREFQREWISSHSRAERQDQSLHWAVSLLGDDRIIGYTGLDDIEVEHGQAELSFWFEAAQDWTSYAAEAAQAALAFAFTDLGLSRVRAFSLAGHEQPAAVLGGAGLHVSRPAKADSAWNEPFKDVLMWETSRSQWINHLQD